jgi:hypothetical protein
MVIGNKAAALLSFGLLLGFSAPAWSAASAAPAGNAQAAPANPHDNTLLGFVNSVLSDPPANAGKPENHCKPSQLYSQHDVVGDPETCVMSRFTLGGDGSAAGVR